MTDHIKSIKLIAQQIREAGGLMDDEEISGKILTTIPASLHYFRCSFESCPIAERTLENLTRRLVREEERLNLLNGGRSSADNAFFGEPETQSIDQRISQRRPSKCLITWAFPSTCL